VIDGPLVVEAGKVGKAEVGACLLGRRPLPLGQDALTRLLCGRVAAGADVEIAAAQQGRSSPKDYNLQSDNAYPDRITNHGYVLMTQSNDQLISTRSAIAKGSA
jgi:hypothetical protein